MLSFCYSYIAKTETADADMQYIVEKKLSGKGTIQHKNQLLNTTILPDIGKKDRHGTLLALFSRVKDKDNIMKQMIDKYYIDMALFGYNVTLYDGKYYATCMDGNMSC